MGPSSGSGIIRSTAADLAAKIKSRELSCGRGDPGPPRPDRRGGRRGARLSARRPGPGPGHRDRRGRQDRRRGAARSAGRGAAGAQGRADLRRSAHHLRFQDLGALDPALLRHRHPAADRCRHRDPRQDQHGRVRHGLLDGELRVRPDPEPVGPDPHSWRLRRRIVGRAGRVRGAAGHRHRHRRLDPSAGGGDRHGRGQAHLRRHVAVRAGRAGLQPGHPGSVRADGAGCRPAASGDRRTRSVRLDLHRRAGSRRGARCPLRRRVRTPGRGGTRAARRGLRPRGRAAATPRRSTCSTGWARRSSRCPARTSATPWPRTT